MYNDDVNIPTNSQTVDFNTSTVGIEAGTSFNVVNTSRNKDKRRPRVVTNKFPDNDTLLRENIMRTVPGNSSYSKMTKRGKKNMYFQ